MRACSILLFVSVVSNQLSEAQVRTGEACLLMHFLTVDIFQVAVFYSPAS